MGRYTGRTRTGPMGHALPDLPGPFLDIECKYRAKIGIHQADFDQAKRNARGKMWAVALKEKNTGRRLVIMDAREFAELLKLAEQAWQSSSQ